MTAAPTLRLRQAAARDGARWVGDGFRAFGRQALAFGAVFALCILGALLLASVPLVGWIVAVVAWPAASLTFLIASRRAIEGGRAMPAAFSELAAGRQRFLELGKLGLAYLACGVFASLLAGWLDGGAFAAMLEAAGNAQKAPDVLAARLNEPAVRNSFFVRMTLTALWAVPFWHAPALVFWGRQGFAKALFFSSVAVWRNFAAFAVYGLAWIAVGIGTSFALGLVLGLFGPALGVALAAPLMMIGWTIFHASLWFTFTGCFTIEPPAATEITP